MRHSAGFAILRCLTVLFCLSPELSRAQSPYDQLLEFADKLCRDPPLVTRNTRTELSAQGKVEINGFLKLFSGGGAEVGAARIDSQSYGVSQDQLAKALTSANDCRKDVAIVFQGMVQQPNRPPAAAARPPSAPARPDNPRQPPIVEAGVAIGDTLDMVKAIAGTQGQFGTDADNRLYFEAPVTFPMQAPSGGTIFRQGSVQFQFKNKMVDLILVRIPEFGPCSEAVSVGIIRSAAIRDLGEIVGTPSQTYKNTVIENMQYYTQITQQTFFGQGEMRGIYVYDSTSTIMPSLKKCLLVVVRQRV